MTTLERYEQKFALAPLTAEEIAEHVDQAEEHMARCTEQGTRTISADEDRVLIWLEERLVAVGEQRMRVPEGARCAHCLRAAGSTDAAWNALPSMTIEDAFAHSQVCEHNPLVVEIRGLKAELDDLRGRKLGNADAWADSAAESLQMYNLVHKLHDTMKANIRALLKTELPAGELRKALGELVK